MEVLTQSIEALSGQGFSAQAKLQEWIEADPLGCSRNALRYLQEAAAKPQEALLRLLSTCDSFSHILASPAVPLPVATELFKRVVHAFPESAYRLMQSVRPGVDSAQLRRTVSLLGAIEDSEIASTLARKLLAHPDPHVHSKANVVFGRANDNPEWLAHWVRDQLRNEDGRVRANAVESLWKKPSKRARQVFRDCLQDSHARVQVNALIGLHYLDEPGIAPMLITLSSDAAVNRRASAAFGMGQIQAEDCLPRLVELLEDPDGVVRKSAFRAVLQIQTSRRAKAAESAVS